MASLQQFLHPQRASVDSPAKIFAKLKSRVRRECEDDVFGDDFYGARRSPKKRVVEDDIEHDDEVFRNGEVTAITLSPISSPQKPRSRSCRPGDELDQHLLRLAPHLNPAYLESTTVSDTTTTQQAHMMEGFHFSDRLVRCEPRDSLFSPMKTRRKRKLDEQGLMKAMISDNDFVHCQERGRRNDRAFSEDEHYTNVRGVNPLPLKSSAGRVVGTAPPHPATPAKIFAYLKEKESRGDQCKPQKLRSSSRPDAQRDECGEVPFKNNRSDSDADSQSEIDGPDSAVSRLKEPLRHEMVKGPVSTVPRQPVVFEDPLLLCSPRVSIPKLQQEVPQAVFKRKKWPQFATFPSENVIHLRKWFIRKTNRGLYVDGIHRDSNIPWNSNLIAERVSKTVLKTITGRVYVLVGKMDLDAPSQFPEWFLKSFAYGFPATWKKIYEKYLSESKSVKRGPQGQSEPRSQKSKPNLEQSLQQQKSVKRAESCPPSTTPNVQKSRSGRIIKPPLDYWRGGRVIVDADMNITVHDGYSSVIEPEVLASAPKSSGFKMPANKAAPVKTPVNDDCVLQESISQSQLQRKVKAPQRRPRNTKGSVVEKPPSPINQVPTDRVLRSSPEAEPQGAIGKSNKEPRVTKAKPAKVSQQTASRQHSPSADNDRSSQPWNRRQEKENTLKKTSAKSIDRNSPLSPPRRSSRSSNSSQEKEPQSNKSQKNQPKTTRKPRSKTPSPPKPTQTTAQPKRTRKRATRNNNKQSSVLDDDAWTEEELRKLQEAVSCYPKHVVGYWTKVAMMVGTRSAEECNNQYSCQGASKTPPKREKKVKQKVPLKEKVDNPVITAQVGTLRRKQQMRDFLDAMPKEDMDDVFSSAYMRSKRFEVPSMCPSDDHEFSMSEPLTPKPSGLPEAKTPQCLHITPGMIGSNSRNYDDKYVFQLQKRMKNHYQFNVQKHAPKNFSPTASVKKTMRRCGNTENNTFVVWEMFPDKEAQADSDEEEDFYFSEND